MDSCFSPSGWWLRKHIALGSWRINPDCSVTGISKKMSTPRLEVMTRRQT